MDQIEENEELNFTPHSPEPIRIKKPRKKSFAVDDDDDSEFDISPASYGANKTDSGKKALNKRNRLEDELESYKERIDLDNDSVVSNEISKLNSFQPETKRIKHSSRLLE